MYVNPSEDLLSLDSLVKDNVKQVEHERLYQIRVETAALFITE